MSGIIDGWARFSHNGELLSLISALVWAISVVLFRVAGEKIHPLAMNFFKNWIALALFGATILIAGTAPPDIPAGTAGLLLLSGVLGIALSDWLFFTALVKLGAELTAIVDCAYSPFVIGLSFLFLGERMTGLQVFGVGLIVGAVLLITQRKTDEKIPPRELVVGVAIGVFSMLLTAGGIVLVKPHLGALTVVWAAFIRMAGGAAAGTALLAAHPLRRRLLEPLRAGQSFGILLPASVLSAYLSVLIWMAGMKYTQASIASALNQLNTIFIFILAAVFLKEKITPLKLAAVILAFAGALLVSAVF